MLYNIFIYKCNIAWNAENNESNETVIKSIKLYQDPVECNSINIVNKGCAFHDFLLEDAIYLWAVDIYGGFVSSFSDEWRFSAAMSE